MLCHFSWVFRGCLFIDFLVLPAFFSELFYQSKHWISRVNSFLYTSYLVIQKNCSIGKILVNYINKLADIGCCHGKYYYSIGSVSDWCDKRGCCCLDNYCSFCFYCNLYFPFAVNIFFFRCYRLFFCSWGIVFKK